MRTDGPVYFASDMHLGAAYIPDPRKHERMIADWLRRVVLPDASRLYLLGDVIDYWWEYRTVAPRGFVRFLGALAEVADAGVEVTWLKGNHDIWIRDYLPNEIGVRVIDGTLIESIGGKRFLMEHGDGVGNLPAGFRMLRRLFRNPVAQALYGAIHPRWTIGLAHAWSSHSRRKGGYMRDAERTDTDVIAPLLNFATGYESAHPGEIDYFVFGHVHRTADVALPAGARMVVLGDWLTRFSYARFASGKLELQIYHDDN